MRPDASADAGYVEALTRIVERIERSLQGLPKKVLPVQMFIAGGAALHLYVGVRVSKDVDAVFSHRVALPPDLKVSYRDADGAARMLYFDYQYNDTLGLVHEQARDDAVVLTLPCIDPKVLSVRLLSATDLTVSKIGRFSEQDRADIVALARAGRIKSDTLRRRAEEALDAYVGDTARVRGAIDIVARLVEAAQR
jgi:hypothetical protein